MTPEPPPACSEDGCKRPKHARDLCNFHYGGQRLARLRESGLTCCMKDCGKPVHNVKRQLCMGHYERYLQHGDPSVTKRPDLGKSVEERFWEKVNKDGPIPDYAPRLGPCWIWTSGLSDGYGQFIIMQGKRGCPIAAHRMAWRLIKGEIPDDLDLDHLCRVRACCNPGHLEPVTNEENIARGMWASAVNSRKTHCIHGHEFTPENTYRPPGRPHHRQCKACMRRREEERKQRRQAA